MFILLFIGGLINGWFLSQTAASCPQWQRVRSVSFDGDPATQKVFTYDGYHRLKHYITGADTTTFYYAGDSVIRLSRSGWDFRTVYMITAQGRASTARVYDGFGELLRQDMFRYDSLGRLTYYYHHLFHNNGITQYRIDYPSDSLMIVCGMMPDGSLDNQYHFRYDASVSHCININVHGSWFDALPEGLLGKGPSGRVKSVTGVSSVGDTVSQLTYRYDILPKEKIIRIKETDQLNHFITKIEYSLD